MSRAGEGQTHRNPDVGVTNQQDRRRGNATPGNQGTGQSQHHQENRSVQQYLTDQLARQFSSSVRIPSTGVIASPTPLLSVVTISIPPIRSSSTTVFGTSATDQLPSVMPIPQHVELQGTWAEEMSAAGATDDGRLGRHHLHDGKEDTPADLQSDGVPKRVDVDPMGSPGISPTPNALNQLVDPNRQQEVQADQAVWREAIFRHNQNHYNELLALILGQQQRTSGDPGVTASPPPSSSTTYIDPRSTEELTASQFRTVLQYINSNNVLRDQITSLRIPPRETTPARDEDYVAAAHIVELLQTTQKLGAATIQTFHNVATLLARHHPLKFRYCTLMAWIHELLHSITAISVHTNQLNEIALPKLFDWSQNQNYFRGTLQIFNITEASVKEALQFAAAVSAYAIRMIRVLEAHQLLHALHCQRVPATDTDKQYAIETLMSTPEPISVEPAVFSEVLQWWRSSYSESLMITTTEGYLRAQELDHTEQHEELAHTVSTEQMEEDNQDAPTTSSRSRSEEEVMQPSLEVKTPPSPPPGPSNTATVDAPVLFARPPAQQGSNMPIQPKPPAKRPSSGEQDRQPPAKASRDGTSSGPVLQHRAATPPAGTTTPPRSPLPRPPPDSSFVCAFCARPEHYSSDCPRHKRLSERVQLAIDKQLCINCLKRHRGNCVRRDPCSRCGTEGHHRAFCLDNPRAIPDIHETRQSYYRRIAEQTFRPYPDPMEDRPPHQITLKEAKARRQAQMQASTSQHTSRWDRPPVSREASSHEEERRRRAEEADDSDNGSW